MVQTFKIDLNTFLCLQTEITDWCIVDCTKRFL